MPADFDGLTAPACPAGHPAACIATSPEGTSYCRWCEDIEAQRQKVRDVSLLVAHARDERDAARQALDAALASVAAVTAQRDQARADADEANEEVWSLRESLEEARLRLAIWSGEGVPDGWRAVADGAPYLTRTVGEHHADVEADGSWSRWRDAHDDRVPFDAEFQSRCPTVTAAKAAAERWLAEQEGER